MKKIITYAMRRFLALAGRQPEWFRLRPQAVINTVISDDGEHTDKVANL
jgi:hypothetical protein